MYELLNKKVLIIGLGKSGIASARYCSKEGARVVATDEKEKNSLGDAIEALSKLNIEFKLGVELKDKFFDDVDLVVVSPGVPLDKPLLIEAMKKKIPVVGELELAMGLIKKPVIAVTGTNGKTTTTSLIGHILNNCGVSACVAGNIGTPLIEVVGEANKKDYVVLELSSFQLETTPSLKVDVAIWLNVTPDHLDRHKTFDEYVAAKCKIVEAVSKNGTCVYSVDDTRVAKEVERHGCNKVACSVQKKLKNGGWLDKNSFKIHLSVGGEDEISLKKFKLSGLHNKENAIAAILAAKIVGCKTENIAAALEKFKGLPHRLEFVRELGGVKYYDDSKGTNIGAVAKSLASFSEPVILILGGLAKGVSFVELQGLVQERVKTLVLIGEAAEQIKRELKGTAQMLEAKDMKEAVSLSHKNAEAGDVVLLSPACASFDMFKSYAHRGEVFVKHVLELE